MNYEKEARKLSERLSSFERYEGMISLNVKMYHIKGLDIEVEDNLFDYFIIDTCDYIINNIKDRYSKFDLFMEDMGFYGRSGGHFCLIHCADIEGLIESDDKQDLILATELLDAADEIFEMVSSVKSQCEQGGWIEYVKENSNYNEDITKKTLGEFLSSGNETIRRNAISIFKQLSK